MNELIEKYENEIKEKKFNLYKIGWHMRGFINYTQMMYLLGPEDIKILQDIISEHLEITKESKLPFF